jgi:ribosomal protein S27E
MFDLIESWIVLTKKGTLIVKCPYCGHKASNPSVRCDECGKVVAMPKEIKKKIWW